MVPRTVRSMAMASGGDWVLWSATRIPSLHRSGPERQGHNGTVAATKHAGPPRYRRPRRSPKAEEALSRADPYTFRYDLRTRSHIFPSHR
jgi:hypothetical protein